MSQDCDQGNRKIKAGKQRIFCKKKKKKQLSSSLFFCRSLLKCAALTFTKTYIYIQLWVTTESKTSCPCFTLWLWGKKGGEDKETGQCPSWFIYPCLFPSCSCMSRTQRPLKTTMGIVKKWKNKIWLVTVARTCCSYWNTASPTTTTVTTITITSSSNSSSSCSCA